MNSRYPTEALLPRAGGAMLRRLRGLQAKAGAPTAAYLSHALGSAVSFVREFADSAREVNKAMERARAERPTISAYRR